MPRRKHLEPTKYPREKMFGHRKYPREKNSDQRRHDGTVARDPREPQRYETYRNQYT